MRGWHADPLQPNFIACPILRQEQAQAYHHRNFPTSQGQRHQRLAFGGLAQSRGVLRRNSDRMRPPSSAKLCRRSAEQLVGPVGKLKLQRTLVPDPVRNEVMKLVVVARRHPLRHRVNALAVARPNQPRDVKRAYPPPRLVAELGQERRKPTRKLLPPIRLVLRSQNQRAKPRLSLVNNLLMCQSSAVAQVRVRHCLMESCYRSPRKEGRRRSIAYALDPCLVIASLRATTAIIRSQSVPWHLSNRAYGILL
jgi:hypothetical protein